MPLNGTMRISIRTVLAGWPVLASQPGPPGWLLPRRQPGPLAVGDARQREARQPACRRSIRDQDVVLQDARALLLEPFAVAARDDERIHETIIDAGERAHIWTE